MFGKSKVLLAASAAAVSFMGCTGSAHATIAIPMVTIGNPGNQADPLTGYGSVPYVYQMSTYDVTAAQYAAFLNSTARTDIFGLYNGAMSPNNSPLSGGITQSGSQGNYVYTVEAGHENFPVNDVSWGDAARFCNWLSNGQPSTGIENASTTEDGSYALNDATGDQALDSVTRSPDATYVIPSLDEWYKSAYYKGGSTNAGYWLYPTQSNTPPSNALSMTGTNNANFDDPVLGLTNPVNGLTPVGAFAGSPGPFGTYDMGGDVSQWTEALSGQERVIEGGSFNSPYQGLQSTISGKGLPSAPAVDIGFRIVEVPEPAGVGLVALAAAALGVRRQRS